jgi:hypothetical protein
MIASIQYFLAAIIRKRAPMEQAMREYPMRFGTKIKTSFAVVFVVVIFATKCFKQFVIEVTKTDYRSDVLSRRNKSVLKQ